MAKKDSTRFAVSYSTLAKTAMLMLEVERLNLLSVVNSRKKYYDSAEHIADFYKLMGLNLAMQELRNTA